MEVESVPTDLILVSNGIEKLSESHDDDSDDNEAILFSRKKKQRAILDDSEEEEEEVHHINNEQANKFQHEGDTLDSLQQQPSEVPTNNIFQDKIDTPEKEHEKSSQLLNNDLYDAELDDSEDEERESGVESDKNSSESEEGTKLECDEDEIEISAALKKRLKKGAAKKPKSSTSEKQQRPKRENIKELHRETQRLVRESAVSLPYHKPEKVDLSVFLARTRQKQEQLKKAKNNLTWRCAIKVAEVKKPVIEESVEFKNPEVISSKMPEKSQSEEVTGKDQEPASDSTEKVKRDISKDLEETVQEDFDSLPDLIMEKEITKVQYEVITSEEAAEDHDLCDDKSLINSTSKPEESGYVSLPTSEEENSGDNSNQQNRDEPFSNNSELNSENITLGTDTLKNSDCMKKQKTCLSPRLANLLVTNITPKLSGAPDTVIDFDEEEEGGKTNSEIPPGIEELMDRVLKHSAKRMPKKSEDVEIMVVTKEEVNDRQEIRVNKLTYHLENEEDSPAKKPGAKLSYLKQKLQEQMKVRRDEARQKRLQAFSLDNEEGYQEEEEEVLDDEEISDETETEEEDSEEDIDEEELLADDTEAAEKEKNPFMDMEAEEDDDVEDDYEEVIENEDDLHLKLDMEDEDVQDDSNGSKAESLVHKKLLPKSKTLELFDEDANTESPEMSQNSKGAVPEISSRPFQELSGSSTKTLIDDVTVNDDDILLLETQSIKSETTSMTRDTSLLSADSSFEGTLIPAGQRSHRTKLNNDRETPDLFLSSSKSSSVTPANKSMSHMSDVVLPIEDSQDLLTETTSRETFPLSQSAPVDFHFQLEDTTQSQMLDEDGLFKVISERKPARHQLILESTRGSNSQNTEDELLGLCSGVFTEESRVSRNLFEADSESGSQNNMDELLNLCSGRFTGRYQNTAEANDDKTQGTSCGESRESDINEILSDISNNSPVKIQPKQHNVIKDEDSEDSFVVASGGEEDQTNDDDEEKLSSADSCEEQSDEEQDAASDDEEMQQAKMFRGFTTANKHGKIRKEFVEEEAELSGSEYESDENLDLPAEEDGWELEEGDLDDVGTEEELRNQVGRVHLKTVIDDDKKELKLFQEMYLQDGDLHTDGAGRHRRFRWRNIDDEDSQQDLFKSDEEGDDAEELQEEKEWRIKRFEREKFLEEQKNEEEADEGSGLIKLGQVVFKTKKNVKTAPKKDNDEDTKTTKPVSSDIKLKENFLKPKLPTHGSFLRRSRDALARIAKLTKPASSGISGASHTGNFVFTAVSDSPREESPRPTQVKRSNSTPLQKQNKRQKVDRSNSLPENSIFRFM